MSSGGGGIGSTLTGRELYDMVQREPTMNTASGMLFEYQVHQLLRKGKTFNLFQIKCTRCTEKFPVPSSLFAFRITLNQDDHALNKTGLGLIDETMGKGMKKVFVIVTEGARPKILGENKYQDAKSEPDVLAADDHLPLMREELFD